VRLVRGGCRRRCRVTQQINRAAAGSVRTIE
jgi:hypothetical protein